MASKLTTVILLALLLIFQGQLWLGRGSVPHVREMQRNLALQEEKNAQMKQSNEQLLADVRDLKSGMALVEDRARSELGMVKPNEIFVQYGK
ncbi:MAG: septum formation initiator family protein [Cytophagales bacterium]|nr:septum formation initiator family protein [Cytophagales bacterium]